MQRIRHRSINVDSLQDIEQALDLVERDLLKNIALVSQVEESKPCTSVDAQAKTMMSVIDDPATALSKFNIRIQVPDTTSSSSNEGPSTKAKLKKAHLEEILHDEDDIIERHQVKRLAASLVASKTKAKSKRKAIRR